MAKKRKRRDWSKEIFYPNPKNDFFQLSTRMKRIFGFRERTKRSQVASIDISGAGRPDRDVPNIAASGRASRDLPDIGGCKRDRSKRSIPDIGGSGRRASKGVPDVGGAGPTSTSPSLGGPPRRRRGRREAVPSIGAMAITGSGDAPNIGGDAAGMPDISGAIGARAGGPKRGGFIGRAMRSFSAYMGFRPLSDADCAEFELFCRRASQAGYEVSESQRLSWRADIMLGKYRSEDLWNNNVGDAIQRRYGKKGVNLDLPEADRPRRGNNAI